MVDGEVREKGSVWRDTPSYVEDGLFLECVAVHPKSSVGKNVTIHIPPEMVASALKTLKEFAIRQRVKPMESRER